MASEATIKARIPSKKEIMCAKKLDESVKKIAEMEGYETYTVSKKNLSTEGASYLAELYTVDITGQTATGDKETNIFIKNKIDNDTIMPIDAAYSREVFAYTEFAKHVELVQNRAQIPKEHRYTMTKFYETDNPDAIFMANMIRKGYMILPTIKEKKCMTLNYAETAMKELAKFHGLFHALNKYDPEFSEILKSLEHPFILKETWREFAKNSVESILEDLKTEEAVVKVRNYIPILLEKFTKYLNGKPKISTICHGDFRIANILTKIENGNVKEQLPIDFQMLHYGNPVNDIQFFIFSSSDRKFRAKHMDYLKDFYYKSLGDFLKYFEINVEDVCPRVDFEETYKETLDFGLMISLQFLSFWCPTENDYIQFNSDIDITKIKPVKHDFFIERLNEVVEDFIDWKYI